MSEHYKFFENDLCEYYQCHKNIERINCMYCFCPLFNTKECVSKKKNDCENCTFPHKEENYSAMIDKLKKLYGGKGGSKKQG